MNNLQNRFPLSNYIFFVHNSANPFDPLTGVQISYENWQKGLANMSLCRVVDCEPIGIDQFLTSCKSVYAYVQCVHVPENAKYTLEQLNQSEPGKPETEADILKREIAELKERLNEASIPQSTKKRK